MIVFIWICEINTKCDIILFTCLNISQNAIKVKTLHATLLSKQWCVVYRCVSVYINKGVDCTIWTTTCYDTPTNLAYCIGLEASILASELKCILIKGFKVEYYTMI